MHLKKRQYLKEKIEMKIKADIKQLAKYTEEERYKMFVEGHNRVATPQRNKKKYTRKEKYKKSFSF